MTTDAAVAAVSLEDTTYTYDGPQGTTSELVVRSPSSSSILSIVMALLNFLAFVAFFVNLATLICLLKHKQVANKKTVNIFVCNQIILDLLPHLPMTVKVALQMSGYYTQTKTGVLSTFMIKLKIKRSFSE